MEMVATEPEGIRRVRLPLRVPRGHIVQVVQDRVLQSGVGLHRGDQNGEVALKLMYQVGNCDVLLGEVSFSVDNDLEVVGNKGTELVEGNEWGLNVVG